MTNLIQKPRTTGLNADRYGRNSAQREKARRQFARKQTSENILVAILMTPVIIIGTVLSAVVLIVLAVLPLVFLGAGLGLIVWGGVDLHNTGFNWPAIGWMVLGFFILTRIKFNRN